ncbi:MAG: low molecular weight phosphotyrosine protein phosphatase [Ignavibacteriales bacterium]|nr:low molecular weight phosphotyrosine protein phosphatase [Ignavibacteriales bacterium]
MINILFVCMGNICRSPAAEAILKKKLRDSNHGERFFVDSAGTIDYHAGELPDPRMIDCGNKRSYKLDHRARKFSPKIDFDKYDYIFTMDELNYTAIVNWDREKKFSNKIKRITDYCNNFKLNQVPDPYYGDENDFNYVLDILEDVCNGIISSLENDKSNY